MGRGGAIVLVALVLLAPVWVPMFVLRLAWVLATGALVRFDGLVKDD